VVIHHNCSFFKKVINFLVTTADHTDGEVAVEEEESMPQGTEEGGLTGRKARWADERAIQASKEEEGEHQAYWAGVG
jgi:hypothetical protein